MTLSTSPTRGASHGYAPVEEVVPYPYDRRERATFTAYFVGGAFAALVLAAVSALVAVVVAPAVHRVVTGTPGIVFSVTEDESGDIFLAQFEVGEETLPRGSFHDAVDFAQRMTLRSLRGLEDRHPARISQDQRYSVQGWLPVKDDFGVITDVAVVNLMYYGITISRIHFDTVPVDAVWNLADDGTVLPTQMWAR